ncbi:MAG: chromate resistance protein [Pseudazoarcus pumilus]|nr:chromate resistance protein [Pseudazoarcus pumilus]
MDFLALFMTLPARQSTARMRTWRALRALGCATLRDGVHVLPDSAQHAGALQEIASVVLQAGGTAEVYGLSGRDETQRTALRAAFDRADDYEALRAELRELRSRVDGRVAADLQPHAQTLRRRFEQIAAIDFFTGDARDHTAHALDELDELLRQHLVPDEPLAVNAAVPQCDRAEYRGRVWATRARPWVDRLASAWLIRRFIDPDATILWLARPADCPADALGFDFDGATFSHVGERVSFETLLASFDLEADPALAGIARVVHYLDVGGTPVPEAAGVESLLAGMRASLADDDALLAAASSAFDFLYQSRSPDSGASR